MEGRIAKVAKEAALMVGPQPHHACHLRLCMLRVTRQAAGESRGLPVTRTCRAARAEA